MPSKNGADPGVLRGAPKNVWRIVQIGVAPPSSGTAARSGTTARTHPPGECFTQGRFSARVTRHEFLTYSMVLTLPRASTRPEGQVQRCLQEKTTNISWWQSGQRTRAKPWQKQQDVPVADGPRVWACSVVANPRECAVLDERMREFRASMRVLMVQALSCDSVQRTCGFSQPTEPYVPS